MTEIPKKMRGVWLTGHGGFEKLDIRNDIPVPIPGSQEVLVRVVAAGVNNTDINTRTAWYSKRGSSSEDASWSGRSINFPLIQGADICGHIVAVGTDISDDRIGERVLVEPFIGKSIAAEHHLQPRVLDGKTDGTITRVDRWP